MKDAAQTNGRPDPLIDEVRELRRQLLERFDGDLERLAEYLREIERRYPGRVIRRDDAKSSKQAS